METSRGKWVMLSRKLIVESKVDVRYSLYQTLFQFRPQYLPPRFQEAYELLSLALFLLL